MTIEFLPFERPIAELEARISELKQTTQGTGINIAEEISKLQAKSHELTEQIFRKLTPSQVVQLARHPQRPHGIDVLQGLFTDLEWLHGDRHYKDDPAILTALGRFHGHPVAIIAHEKGRETPDKIHHNFGMPKPEGYRKALRIMKLAERFQLPLLTFIDTPGAYPGIGAEERNQSEAIARNLFEMSQLKTPILTTVIGEGGSGGALAIGVADHCAMMAYSIYSVISPEGCASILWKSVERMSDAAEALQLTAQQIADQGLIDAIIPEPLGGAHRDPDYTVRLMDQHLHDTLNQLISQPIDDLLEQRYHRLMLRESSHA